MKRIYKFLTVAIVLGLLVSLVGFASPVSGEAPQGNNLASDRLLVRFKPGTPWNDMAEVHQRVGGKVESIIPRIGVQVVTVPRGQGASKSAAYRLHKEVGYVEPDSIAQIVDLPNDPYFSSQWGLTRVQAAQAWDMTSGSSDVRIAILDTGIDMDHPDLAAKIVSDVNFSDSPTSDYNGHSHGTHVAGIAAAITNNSLGVAGLGRNCSVLNVKVLDDSGYGYYSSVAEGIIWAADNGADVINLSLGGSSPSTTMEDAVDYAWSRGVVVVAAAGNGGSSSPFYPAYYANCIAVGATDASDNLASFSNRGTWVDVAAPGSSIYSTMPDGQYGYKQGTSMACPHVAGLAALVFSVATDSNGNGRLNDEVRSIIENTCDDVGIDVACGRINAYRAVQGFQPLPTGQIAGVVTDATTGNAISGATVSDGSRSASTDSDGYYCITDVAEGSHTVTASADGYEASSQSNVVVNAGDTVTTDFLLTAKPPAGETMWIQSITFTPSRKHLSITVEVVNPEPVRKAEVTLELIKDGTLLAEFSGLTNPAGEVTFSWKHAANGEYLANVTMLTHKLYVWDKSKGTIPVTYMLSR